MTDSTVDTHNNADVPAYFDQLRRDAGVTRRFPQQIELFIQLVTALHKMGCSEETVRILCVQEQYLSVKRLQSARLLFRDYRDFKVEIHQARLLVEKVQLMKSSSLDTNSTPKVKLLVTQSVPVASSQDRIALIRRAHKNVIQKQQGMQQQVACS